MAEIGDIVEVVIEVPRGGFVKRRADGSVDFVSPVPCPFNYGSARGTLADDGDPLDVVLLGPRRPPGFAGRFRIWSVVDFVDAGQADPKLVCGPTPPTAADRRRVRVFFRLYARVKRLLNRARGQRGVTLCRGLVRS